MCGPIAATVSLAAAPAPLVGIGNPSPLTPSVAPQARSRGAQPRGRAAQVLAVGLAYNAGRVTTYAAIGFAMGLGGSFVNGAARLAGWQDAASVIAGALMVLFGLGALGLTTVARRIEQRASARVFGAARAVLEGGGPARSYPLGLLLGFLPCGLSYSAFMAAAATGGPGAGLAVALAFGVGTTPALLLAGAAAGAIGPRLRGALHRLGGLLVVVFGLLLVLRGLGLPGPG
jgi:sulfite exporter TauE/SafE